jgi:hypothetical protein
MLCVVGMIRTLTWLRKLQVRAVRGRISHGDRLTGRDVCRRAEHRRSAVKFHAVPVPRGRRYGRALTRGASPEPPADWSPRAPCATRSCATGGHQLALCDRDVDSLRSPPPPRPTDDFPAARPSEEAYGLTGQMLRSPIVSDARRRAPSFGIRQSARPTSSRACDPLRHGPRRASAYFSIAHANLPSTRTAGILRSTRRQWATGRFSACAGCWRRVRDAQRWRVVARARRFTQNPLQDGRLSGPDASPASRCDSRASSAIYVANDRTYDHLAVHDIVGDKWPYLAVARSPHRHIVPMSREAVDSRPLRPSISDALREVHPRSESPAPACRATHAVDTRLHRPATGPKRGRTVANRTDRTPRWRPARLSSLFVNLLPSPCVSVSRLCLSRV